MKKTYEKILINIARYHKKFANLWWKGSRGHTDELFNGVYDREDCLGEKPVYGGEFPPPPTEHNPDKSYEHKFLITSSRLAHGTQHTHTHTHTLQGTIFLMRHNE